MPGLYLASASPRRRALLRQIGADFQTVPAGVDESHRAGEGAEAHVSRLALAKARAGARRRPGGAPVPVLGADTSIELDGRILGKPRGREDGIGMLEALSGRWHRVLTAVALVGPGAELARVQVSRVRFRHLSRTEREQYWETGEPAGKAGAYAIQGLAAIFIAELRGSYSGVMGLPLFETAELLRELDIPILIRR